MATNVMAATKAGLEIGNANLVNSLNLLAPKFAADSIILIALLLKAYFVIK